MVSVQMVILNPNPANLILSLYSKANGRKKSGTQKCVREKEASLAPVSAESCQGGVFYQLHKDISFQRLMLYISVAEMVGFHAVGIGGCGLRIKCGPSERALSFSHQAER